MKLNISNAMTKLMSIVFLLTLIFGNFSPLHASGKMKKTFTSGIYKKLKNNQYDKAIKKCKRMQKMHVYRDEAYFLEGLAYYFKKDYVMAVEIFSKSIELNGNRGDAYFFRGYSNLSLKKPSAALVDINMAMERKNTPALLAYLNKQLGYSPLETVTKASMFWQRYLIYINQKNYESAFKDINQAINISPVAYPNWYKARGNIYFLQNKFTLALKDFQKTIQINPKDSTVWREIGLINFYFGDYKIYITSCKKVLQINPKDMTIAGNLSLGYWMNGDHQMAINLMKKVIKKHPDAMQQYHLAYFYHAIGKQDLALENFKNAQKLTPNILELRKKYLNIPPKNSPTKKFYEEEYNIAKSYIETGKTPNAIAYANRIPEITIEEIRISPNPVLVNQPFEIDVNFNVDMPGNDEEVSILFNFKITQNNQVLFESEPNAIKANNRKPTHWNIHMNPVPVKGIYTLKGFLKYKQIVAIKSITLTIK